MDIGLGTRLYLWSSFFNPHMLSPSLFRTNNVALDACIQNFFSEFHYCVGWQEGELQQNFEKNALFNKGTQRLQKIVITALLSQGLLARL